MFREIQHHSNVRAHGAMRHARVTFFCSGNTINITHFECVFVAFFIQHAIRMLHIVFYGLPDCALFSHIIWQK